MSKIFTLFSHGLFVWALIIAGQTVPGLAQSASPGSPSRIWPEGRQAALSFSFDDARPSQIDQGIPLLARLGVRASFYVSLPNLRQRPEDWRKAAQAGHEIGNHTLSHPCSGNFAWSRQRALEDFDWPRMRQEIAGANAEISALLGILPSTFAYPCGQTFIGRGVATRSYVPLVAELFVAGRGWRDESFNDPQHVDLAQLQAVPSDNASSDELRQLLDQTIAQGGWLILAGHDIAESDARQTTRPSIIVALLQYATGPSRGVWVDTIERISRHIVSQRQPASLQPTRRQLLPEQ